MTKTPASPLRHRTRRSRGESFRKHAVDTCPVTGAARYRDRKQARDAANATMWSREKKGGSSSPMSVYRCPEATCGYHLESRAAAAERAGTAAAASTVSPADRAPRPVVAPVYFSHATAIAA
ncbi:hypothetical protein [Pseudolysinimonas yzui]|uniref:Uncharacterized protein n=1 Tax=Pseudolysinimonas yzui TaxID=2708254 RepID=A0A8J3GQI3_9MICO|nr:hypothetical protein [Pseudolysinimonas yzui]GHF14677.1 hypothetical protein GCM10011600_14530 [Pseudolysinimonas yzui]